MAESGTSTAETQQAATLDESRFAQLLEKEFKPKTDRARQDRLVQGKGGHGKVAQQLDHELRRTGSGQCSEEAKARRPLVAAEVKLEEVAEDPGYYRSVFI